MATQPSLANNRVQVVCHDHKASDRSRENDAGACEFSRDTNTIYDRINHLPRAATRGNRRHGEKTVGSTRGEVPALERGAVLFIVRPRFFRGRHSKGQRETAVSWVAVQQDR